MRVLFVASTLTLIGLLLPTVALADPPEAELYGFLARFHGHTCGGSLMGARLGWSAKNALQRIGGEGTVRARYHDGSCPVDGIQVAAGTTLGNGAIELADRDEHRLLLWSENGRQVEARLTETALAKGRSSRELSKKARALPAGSSERVRMEQEVERLFAWFRTAPEGEVVLIREMPPKR